jgi:MFS family permease
MAGDDADGVDWRAPTVYVLVAASMVGPMDSPLVGPALPGAKADLGLTDAQTGLFITALALPGVVAAPLVGMAADRYGRTRILAGCLAVYGLAGAAVALAGSFPLILALRFLQGVVGSSILASLAMTLIGDFYEGPARNAAMGVLGGGTTFAVAAYPSIGGVLADVGWRVPFVLYLAGVGVALAVVVWVDEPDREGTPMGPAYLRDAVAAVPTGRALLLYGAAAWSFLLLFGGVITVVPLVLDGQYGLSATGIGAVITAALLVTAVVSVSNGLLATRLSTGSLLALGFVGYGVGLAGASVAPSPATIAGALVFFGVGHGLTFPTLATAISGLADARFRAGVMSVRTSTLMAGQAVGPWLFPVIGGYTGYPTLLLGAGACSIALGVGALAALSRSNRVRPAVG